MTDTNWKVERFNVARTIVVTEPSGVTHELLKGDIVHPRAERLFDRLIEALNEKRVAAPAVPQGTNWHAHHVIVGKAALQMVRNALRNDMERGLIVRGEMLEELDKVTYSATPAAPLQPVTLTDDKIEQLAVDSEIVFRRGGKLLTPFLEHIDLRRNVNAFANAIIAALREKEKRA